MKQLIAAATGDTPADLLLTNCRVVNTFTGEIEKAAVAIWGEWVAGVGDYVQAKKVIDLEGRYIAPGLIDGHTHIESSLLHPAQYARAVVPHGTSAVVTDLHEIANVSGLEGMRYVLDEARRLPLDLFLMAPSCVPATPSESSGAVLGEKELRTAKRWQNVAGLGEMMNFPGVISGDSEVLKKLSLFQGGVIDGHAPGLKGKQLNAYVAAGILSDHESTSYEEGREKLRRGMRLMLREGPSEKNLEAMLPLVTDQTYKRCFFVVDDRSCSDLVRDGDIDAVVRKAIKLGLEPVRALQLATINAAEYFRLPRRGAVAPGFVANLLVVNDLSRLEIEQVYYKGRLVAEKGKPLFAAPRLSGERLRHTVKVKPFPIEALKIPAERSGAPVIEVVPGQIITKKTYYKARVVDGALQTDPQSDILKLAVVERHKATGHIGVGLVKGFGLKHGALASSVAHDSHNIAAVGVGDSDIYAAVKEIEKLQGGLVAVSDGKVVASLPLPVAGLLSDLPLEEVVNRLESLQGAAAKLGCSLPSPFATLSFLALPVIPELRLTDKGLVEL